MIFTTHKGKRRPAGWWKRLRLWRNKKTISVLVMFDQSAQYKLPADDQADTNKLFGLGFLWNRKYSARFCWNWNEQTHKINLYAYFHRAGMTDSANVNGAMDFVKLMELELFQFYRLSLRVRPDNYEFLVSSQSGQLEHKSIKVSKGHKKRWSYWLGPYFGGTRKAPHDITFIMKNL
jgi:hypothetical protein